MPLRDQFLSELTVEGAKTIKMLERVSPEHFSWKPHEKSNDTRETGFTYC